MRGWPASLSFPNIGRGPLGTCNKHREPPAVAAANTVTLANGRQFSAPAGTSLLEAARQAGLVLPHSCRSGACGACRVGLVSGAVQLVPGTMPRADAPADAAGVLTCVSAACSDLVLDAEDLGPAANLPVRTWPARIARLERLAPDVLRVLLRLPPGADFSFLPGQYLRLAGPGGHRRSYSMAAAPVAGAPVELHVRAVAGGALSQYWFGQAREGDLLRFDGPHGTAFLRDVAGRQVVCLATGTGIAPIKAMLEALWRLPAERQPRALHLLWGGRVPAHLYWTPPDGTPPWFSFTPVLSRAGAGWTGARGHVQNVLLAMVPDLRGAVAHVCGAPAMVDDARQRLVAAGIAPRDCHADAFVSA